MSIIFASTFMPPDFKPFARPIVRMQAFRSFRITRRIVIGAFALLAGCRNGNSPVPAPHLEIKSPLFSEVSQSAGIRYKWTIPVNRPLNILQTIGNGCAFLDFDNDGNPDILLVGSKPALFCG